MNDGLFTDFVESEMRRLRRARRTIALVVVLVLCVLWNVIVALRQPHANALDEAGERALLQAITAATQRLDAKERRWTRALAGVPQPLQPGARPCSLTLRGPTDEAASTYRDTGAIDPGGTIGNTVYREVADFQHLEPCGECQRQRDELNRLSQRVHDKEGRTTDLSFVEGVGDDRDLRIFLQVEERTAPHAYRDAYLPGRLRGRALIAEASQGFVCIADLDVENTGSLVVKFKPRFFSLDRNEARDILERDLELQVRTAIATNARAIE